MIREVIKATGDIITVAGNGVAGYSGDGGPATDAELDGPNTVAVDAADDLFIADLDNNAVREVVKATGDIITIAGDGTAGYSGDGGPATAAELNLDQGVAVDSLGDVFIADDGNHVVREVVKATGDIITVAGDGTPGYSGDDGPATDAELNNPCRVAVDAAGDVFIADRNNNVVREITPAATVTISLTPTPTPTPIPTPTPTPTPPRRPPTPTPTPTLTPTPTPTPTSTPTPIPMIIGEQVLRRQRRNKKGKPVGKPVLVGFALDYSTTMNPATAGLTANYQITSTTNKRVKKQTVTVFQPVASGAAYNASNESVTLFIQGEPKFAKGGQIKVIYSPPSGVSSEGGVPLDASDSEFTILRNATGIEPD